jgi:hypothetical protein
MYMYFPFKQFEFIIFKNSLESTCQLAPATVKVNKRCIFERISTYTSRELHRRSLVITDELSCIGYY